MTVLMIIVSFFWTSALRTISIFVVTSVTFISALLCWFLIPYVLFSFKPTIYLFKSRVDCKVVDFSHSGFFFMAVPLVIMVVSVSMFAMLSVVIVAVFHIFVLAIPVISLFVVFLFGIP